MKSPTLKKLMLVFGSAFVLQAATVQAQSTAWSESYRLETALKYADALKQMDSVLSTQPKNELAVLRSGWLLYLLGKYPEAQRQYQKALDMNPVSITGLLGVMQQQMAQLLFVDARQTGLRILKDSPWDYNAQVNIMYCDNKLSAWADLAKRAAAVSERYPTDATVLVYWARAESALNNKKHARDLYARVLEIVPGHIEATAYLKAPS